MVRQPCLRYPSPQRLYVGHIPEMFFKHCRPNWSLNLRIADIRHRQLGVNTGLLLSRKLTATPLLLLPN